MVTLSLQVFCILELKERSKHSHVSLLLATRSSSINYMMEVVFFSFLNMGATGLWGANKISVLGLINVYLTCVRVWLMYVDRIHGNF